MCLIWYHLPQPQLSPVFCSRSCHLSEGFYTDHKQQVTNTSKFMNSTEAAVFLENMWHKLKTGAGRPRWRIVVKYFFFWEWNMDDQIKNNKCANWVCEKFTAEFSVDLLILFHHKELKTEQNINLDILIETCCVHFTESTRNCVIN